MLSSIISKANETLDFFNIKSFFTLQSISEMNFSRWRVKIFNQTLHLFILLLSALKAREINLETFF